MYQVVVIDDEPMIRAGIRKMLENLPNWEWVGEAENGKNALQLIEKLGPDLVISDIRMPGIDGLTLLEEVRGRGLETLFILLTGHPDFHYAQKGIRLDAFEYLLKPCSAAVLTDVLQRAERQIDQHKKSAKAYDSWVENALLRDLLYGKPIDRADYTDIPFYNSDRALVAVSLHIVKSDADLLCDFLKRHIKSANILMIPDGIDEMVVVLSMTSTETQDGKSMLKKHLSEFAKLNLSGAEWKAGIGQSYPVVEGAAASFAQSKFALRYASQACSILFFDEIAEHQKELLFIPAEVEAALLQAIHKGDRKEAEEAFVPVAAVLANMTWDEQCRYANQLLMRLPSRTSPESRMDFEMFDLSRESSSRRDKLIRQLKEQVDRAVERAYAVLHNQQGAVVQRAVQYIREHYDQDIMLASIAQKIKMNPSYLSVLFKQETGTTFSDYLTIYRMEQAKQLLKHSDLKVYEVAGKVGYASGRHFSQGFKKQFDMTPNEFRVSLDLSSLDE